jgi:hypothetical protein
VTLLVPVEEDFAEALEDSDIVEALAVAKRAIVGVNE